MSSETNIEDLFQKWNELNTNTGASLGSFDFESIKKNRNQMRDLEDKIYLILLKNAPDDIKKILPEGCGEFEIGYNVTDQIFYFLTYDPEQEDEEAPAEIIAITLDINNKVDKIKNFKIDEPE
jgi:hypothetical protein